MALNNVMFDMRRFAKTKRLMDIEDPEKADEAINKYVAKQIQAAAAGGERVRARVNAGNPSKHDLHGPYQIG